MTPEDYGKHPARPFWLFSPALIALLLFGCGQQADSAETTILAQAERPIIRPNLGYPRPMQPNPNSPATRLPAKVESKLPIYEIRMDPQHLEAMDMNPYGEESYPATFTANGTVYENVKIRYRGAWGRTWPKKPMKIFFNEDKMFNGQRRLNLNSGWRDPAFIRETLAYHIYHASGAAASTSRLARVHLNGAMRGLYVEVEQPDKEFLKRRGLKGGTIFKASSRAKMGDERAFGSVDEYRMHYEQETQKDQENSFAELHKFCSQLENTQNAAEFFNRHVDLEKYINYLAATTLCQNWDGYNKNHFLVYDANESKKWFVLPWDLDRSLGDHWDWSFGNARLPIELGTSRMPAITGWNRMHDRFFSDPTLRARFADRLQELLEKEFTTEKLHPVIDQLAADIAPEARLDRQIWPVADPDVKSATLLIKDFIKDRRAYLLQELPRFRKASAARARVQ
jgi:spore coat protein H